MTLDPKDIPLEPSQIIGKIGEIIFAEIYPEKKFRYNSKYEFAFNRQVDDQPYGSQDAELGLRIITPLYGNYSEDGEEEFYAMSFGGKNIVLKLPSIAGLQDEIKTGRARVKSLLASAFSGAQIYYNAQRLELQSGQPVERINKALQTMVEGVYSKLHYVREFASSTADIAEILTGRQGQLTLVMDEPNQPALDEMDDYIDRCQARNIRVSMKMLLGRFRAAPYGWQEIDTAALTARLFKLQRIKLQHGAQYLEITDQEIPNYLTKRTEVTKLTLTRRTMVSAELLQRARDIGRSLFDYAALPQDEDGLMRELKDLIRKEADAINTDLNNYRRGGYPGKAALESCLDMLKRIARIRDAEELFDALGESEAELIAAMREAKKVRGFFQNQLSDFNKALKMLDIFRDNETYVLDKEINATVHKVRTIVEKPDPYPEIVDLPGLIAKFNARFAQLLEEKCQPIKQKIQADYRQVKEELRKHDPKSRLMDEINQAFTDLLDRIDSVNNFYKAIAMETESEILKLRWFDRIAENLKFAGLPGFGLPAAGGAKTTQHLNAAELVRTAPLMTTEAEVDRFVDELRDKLKGYIRENKNVRLV